VRVTAQRSGASADVTAYDFDATTIDGTPFPLAGLRGRVLLVVNVASYCGFTPQYRALEALYRRHRDEGFVVLGFPCNQFGRQEPGGPEAIREFCAREYGVTFPLFEKTDVNGRHAHPLFQYLKAQSPGRLGVTRIAWNFTKFLVDRRGRVVRRYGSRVAPMAIEPDVVVALSEGRP